MPSLSASSKETIQAVLDAATAPSTGLSGLVFCAIDKSGNYLTQQYSGRRALAPTAPPMDADSVFWIASCTKMITGIACMQLVERGLLELDSAEAVYRLAPELKAKKVLKEDGTLEERKADITLRMLLNHTAGFGYSFFNERLRDYALPTGWDEFSGDVEDIMEMPLVNQPGSRWEYGINIDWAGILVERATGQKLDAYFKQHIFEPLGIEHITFIPTKHMRENLVTMQQRGADGKTADADHLMRRAVWHAEREHRDIFNSGGAGCFAKPAEYCKILSTLLNNGTSPTTQHTLLSPKSISQIFTNSIPQFPSFGRQGVPASKPTLTNPLPDLYPQGPDAPQGWGLTFMLTLEAGMTGRAPGTAHWAGLVNLFWWCDREKGVAGMIAGQVLPFGDGEVLGAWVGCEKAVYDGLEG